MLTRFYELALLAEIRRPDLRELSAGFRDRSAWDNAPQAVMFAIIIVVIAVVLLVVGRFSLDYEQRQSKNSSSGLFRELCRIHNLDRASKRLLKRLAAHRKLDTPALLFVNPHCFAQATLPLELRDQADAIDRLHHQLFGPG